MKGWKTWVAVVGSIGLGLIEIAGGDTEAGVGHIVFGFGLIGIGHKIEKNAG
ncbi:MAG: hypothetical protein JZU65_14770 [Chlorobium sp.]|nr:hypothetical protein [Chlorobium sp.]